jgi:hypothetical protein
MDINGGPRWRSSAAEPELPGATAGAKVVETWFSWVDVLFPTFFYKSVAFLSDFPFPSEEDVID